MKIVKRNVEFVNSPSYDNVLMTFNTAARNCYQSESVKTTNIESAEKMARALIRSNHVSTLEHNNIAVKIMADRSCYDTHTEVLTFEGWKFFKDVTLDDRIATLNPISGEVEFNKPTELINYRYNGDMYYFKSTNYDLAVTANHNMWAKKLEVSGEPKYEMVEAQNMINRYSLDKRFNYINNNYENIVTIKGIGYEQRSKDSNDKKYYKYISDDMVIDKNVFCKFMAMYLSEGSCGRAGKKATFRTSMTQVEYITGNKEKRDKMVDVIASMGLIPCKDKKNVSFSDITMGSFLNKLGTASEKYFPFNIYEFFNKDTAKLFIDTYIEYDGCKNVTYGKLYTSSKKLAEQLELIAMMAGINAHTITRYEDRIGEAIMIAGSPAKINHVNYIINLSNKQNYTPYVEISRNLTIKEYHDEVYCVNVKNHIIMTKRNGDYVWCGNCMGQITRHRIASYSIESLRYCNMSLDKFGNSVKFIIPHDMTDEGYDVWRASCLVSEQAYFELLDKGCKAETARSVLPLCTATTIVMSANIREWRSIFDLRCDSHAQSDIREVMTKLLNMMYEEYPVFFEDLYSKFKG